MRFFILSALLLTIAQCGYPVAPQGSYPTPPDSYVMPKANGYAMAPGAYATKPSFNQRREQGPVPPPPPPPNPAHYQDQGVEASETSVQNAPPAPHQESEVGGGSDPSVSSFSSVPAAPAPSAPAAPTFGGSVSSGTIAGGSALNYNTAAPAYRRRAKAKAKARRARARTVQNRKLQKRRPLQPIRRLRKKARQ